MNKKTFFISLFLILLFVAFLFFKKSGKKSDTNIKLKLKQSDTYNLPDEISSVKNFFIENKKIYILDYYSKAVFILNEKFKIIRIINKRGKGPGEFLQPMFIYNDIYKKQLVVIDMERISELRFDYNGNFIEQNQLKNFEFCTKEEKFHNGIVKRIFKIDFRNNKLEDTARIEIMQGNKKVKLCEYTKDPKSFNLPIFCCIDDRIFINIPDTDMYLIKVFDEDGKNIYNISKRYNRVKKSEKEVEYDEMINEAYNDKKGKILKNNFNFSIRQILVYQNDLWVLTQSSDTSFFDIIDKNGSFKNKIMLNRKIIGHFFVLNNFMYEIIMNKNERYKINKYILKGF